mmetsp:Transcript_9864/g.16316  ORF Transcript_9864/g.16316 Transcript_9864/m.16316 type:complete len:89 (-) Transcript_9864:75-341(-)
MRQPARTQMLAPSNIWDCLIGRRDRSLLVRGYCYGRKTQEEIAAGSFASSWSFQFLSLFFLCRLCVDEWHLKLTVRVSPSSAIIASYN